MGVPIKINPGHIPNERVQRMSPKERANLVRGQAGGRPLQSLSNRSQRKLKQHDSTYHRSRSIYEPHQGSKEMERRRKRMEREAAKRNG